MIKPKKTAVKFMGLDFGDKTIGVSISHDMRVATGVTTIKRTDETAFKPALKQLKEIIKKYEITHILLGNPINLSGEPSERTAKTIEFKDKLLRYFKNISVELWDERLSTKAVTRMYEGKKEDIKKHVDEMAAVYILQGYLDYRRQAMVNEPIAWDENEEDDIVLYSEDGDEMPLQILSSCEDESGMYVLALEGDEDDEDSGVAHFKLMPGDDDDMIFELIDQDHEDFKKVFTMFKDDYEALEIDIEGIEI